MTIAVIGSIFVDIKGYPSDIYISQGRNAGRVEQVHGGVGRNVAADIPVWDSIPCLSALWITPEWVKMLYVN